MEMYSNDPTRNAGALTSHDPTAAQGSSTYAGVLKRWTGSEWVRSTLKIWDGGQWVSKPLKIFLGEWREIDATG